MAPTVQSGSTLLTAAVAANAVVTLPSSIVANDVVIVTLYKENTAAVTTVPSGFTEKGTAPTTTTTSLNTFWKRMAGGESGTITFAWTGSVFREAIAVRIDGAITSGDPIEGVNSNQSNSANALNVSLGSTTADSLLHIASGSFATGTDWSWSASFVEYQDGSDMAAAAKANAAGGATGTLTATATTTDQMTATLSSILGVPSSSTLTFLRPTMTPRTV